MVPPYRVGSTHPLTENTSSTDLQHLPPVNDTSLYPCATAVRPRCSRPSRRLPTPRRPTGPESLDAQSRRRRCAPGRRRSPRPDAILEPVPDRLRHIATAGFLYCASPVWESIDVSTRSPFWRGDLR